MPTEIALTNYHGGKGYQLIGFCMETPSEVLSEVFKTHNVVSYKSVPYPIVNNGHSGGLVISEAKAPTGTIIAGKLKDLGDLVLGKRKSDSPLTREGHIRALKLAAGVENLEKLHNLSDDSITALKEVAQITLGIKNPTTAKLIEILMGK